MSLTEESSTPEQSIEKSSKTAQSLWKRFVEVPPTVWVLRGVALLAIPLLLLLACNLESTWALNLSVALFGAAAGAGAGLLFSPWGSKDEKEFAVYRRAIAVFLGGYVLGKADAIISFLGKEKLLQPMTLRRILLFCCAFVLATIIVFGSRRYYKDEEETGGKDKKVE